MKTLKWLLLAVGAYLLYRWWADSQPEAAAGELPADAGMYEGDGGGGGGGGGSTGYQDTQNVTPDPTPTQTAAPSVKPVRNLGVQGTPRPRTPLSTTIDAHPSKFKPGSVLGPRPRLKTPSKTLVGGAITGKTIK